MKMRIFYPIPTVLFLLLVLATPSFGAATFSERLIQAQNNATTATESDWDWTSSDPVTLHITNWNKPHNIVTPFWGGTGYACARFSNHPARDMYPKDGWVLLYQNFGTPEIPQEAPKYMLYNRFTGVLRVFYFLPAELLPQNYSYAIMMLTHKDPSRATTMFVPSLDRISFTSYDKEQVMTFTGHVLGNNWNYAEFQILGYDKEIPDYSKLTFLLDGITLSDVNLQLHGFINTINQGGGNMTFMGTFMKNSNNMILGLDLINSASKIFFGPLDMAGHLSSLASGGLSGSWLQSFLSAGAFAITGFNPVMPELSLAINGVKSLVEVVGPGLDIPQSIGGVSNQIDATISGSITTSHEITAFNLGVPGSNHGTDIYDLPLYDKPLGLYNIENAPKLHLYMNYNEYYQNYYRYSYAYRIEEPVISINPYAGTLERMECSMLPMSSEAEGYMDVSQIELESNLFDRNVHIFPPVDWQDILYDMQEVYRRYYKRNVGLRMTFVPDYSAGTNNDSTNTDSRIEVINIAKRLEPSVLRHWQEAFPGASQTIPSMSGGVNSTRTLSSGMYKIESDFTISNNSTWTIQPGTTIYLGSNVDIIVSPGSKIIATGTRDNPIRFKRLNLDQNWGDIELRSNNNSFEYCLFDGAHYAVHNRGMENYFNHCTFKNSFRGFRAFSNYSGGGWSSFLLKYCMIEGNDYGVAAKYSYGLLFKDTIRGNKYYGLLVESASLGNHAFSSWSGGTNGLRNNLITGNGEEGIKLGAGGQVWLGRGSSPGANRICNNGGREILLLNATTPAHLYAGSASAFGRNDIYDHVNGGVYVENQGTGYCTVGRNYWGTDDPASVLSSVLSGTYTYGTVAYAETAAFGDEAGTDGGIFDSPLSKEAIPEAISESLPTEWVIGQNYPNPFNAVTMVPITLPDGGRVALEVFNVIGQRVAILADRDFKAGKHTLTFDASQLSTGIYILRGTIHPHSGEGDVAFVHKMVMMK